MTFKDLQKLVQSQSGPEQSPSFAKTKKQTILDMGP